MDVRPLLRPCSAYCANSGDNKSIRHFLSDLWLLSVWRDWVNSSTLIREHRRSQNESISDGSMTTGLMSLARLSTSSRDVHSIDRWKQEGRSNFSGGEL